MEAESGRLRGARALHAFRSRDFRLLWSARTVSLVGDGAFLIALGWRTTTLTGSATSLAIVLMAHSAALLTTVLIGGALADRYSRRMLMICSDLARVLIMGALALLDASGHLSFGLLLALAVGLRARGRLLLPRRRRDRAARRGVARARVGQHADRHLPPGVVRDRPCARRLDLRRRGLGGGLRPQLDHVPRLGGTTRAGTTALVRARAERGHVEVDRRRHALRRGRAVAVGRDRRHVRRADGGDGAVPGARADLRLRAVRQGRRRLRSPLRLRGGGDDDRHDRVRPDQPRRRIGSGRSSASSL